MKQTKTIQLCREISHFVHKNHLGSYVVKMNNMPLFYLVSKYQIEKFMNNVRIQMPRGSAYTIEHNQALYN